MEIRDRRFITPASVFKAAGVTDTTGNKRLRELEARGEVQPEMTAAGRRKLSIAEAERLAAAL